MKVSYVDNPSCPSSFCALQLPMYHTPVARYIPFLTLNKHCLIDVLVSTKRPVARFADLPSDEVADPSHCTSPGEGLSTLLIQLKLVNYRV